MRSLSSRGLAVSSFALVLFACGGDDASNEGGGSSGTTPSADAGLDSGTKGEDASAPPPAGQFSVGGTVTGLKGSGLALKLNGGGELVVNGPSFKFSDKVASGKAYQVTVSAQPKTPKQTCTVKSGAGTIASANVENVVVTCVDDTFPVNVVVSGLVTGTTLVLQNNGGDDLSVTMPGTVAFPTALTNGGAFEVTVKTQPTGPAQTCTVTSGVGTIAGSAANITVACAKHWTNSRAITVTSDLAAAAVNHQVLVTLDAAFTYAKANANGDDLRFSSTAAFTDSLPYFIESWTPAGVSYVWVKVPTVPVGASEIYMHYGRATATAASSFATTFPGAQVTAGAGAGSFAADADIDVDWFELKAGDTLTLQAATPRSISARRIIIAGTIDGIGRGFASVGAAPGNGPGGGGSSTNSGAGGAGYGGIGGIGGYDSGDTPGAGGAASGTEMGVDIGLGSGAGSSDNSLGGAGGGAITLSGTFVSVPGTIHLDGTNGASGSRCGGGGSGGGLLTRGVRLDLTGGTVTANGGLGGVGTIAANDGGGGGGGGRLKFFGREFFAPAGTMSVAFGVGGGFGDTASGQSGAVGTTHSTSAALAADAPAVRSAVGTEN